MKSNFFRKVLKNGMTVILEKRNLPIISVSFAVRNGGINENSDEKGISHFIEHMLFKGTPKRDAKKIADEIEKKGGELNGFTSEEITAFWCKIPSRHLNLALDVLSDMIKNPKFDKKELEKERKVILEEIKMIKDNPIAFAFENIQNCLYEEPFGKSLIGTEETLNSITREKIYEKFKKVYAPNNLILCVVGDTDFDKLVSFAENNFGNEKGQNNKIEVKLKNKSKFEKRKGIDQANLIFAYHVPLAKDNKSYAATVLGSLMAEGMSSRLFSEIREKRNLVYSIKGDCNINSNFAYNTIYAGTLKKNVELIRKLILKEFKKVANGLKEKELNQTKEQLIGNHQISMEDSQRQMVNLLLNELVGNAETFYEFENKVKKVKLKDVKVLARKAAKENSFFALVPEN